MSMERHSIAPASISTSVIGLPVGPWMGFASTSIDDVLTPGYEVPSFERDGVAFPPDSDLTAGERGGFTSPDVEGVRPDGPLIALMRDAALYRGSTLPQDAGSGNRTRSARVFVRPCAR